MVKYIKIHLTYLINKNNLIVIFIGILIYLIFCFFSSCFYKSIDEQILYEINYRNSYDSFVMSFSKLFLVLFSCYIFSYSFIKNNSYRNILQLTSGSFYLSKIISIIFIILFLNFSFYLGYVFVGLGTRWFIFNYEMLIYFFRLTLESIILGLISLLVSYLFYNTFPFLIVFFLYMLLENFSNYEIIHYISIFIPVVNINNSYTLSVWVILYIQTIFYLLLGYFLFNKIERFNS